MRLDAQSGIRGLLVNVETGQPIRFVVWADVPEDPAQQGSYEAWRFHPDECRDRYRQGQPREQLVYQGRCRMRFVPSAPLFGPKPSTRRDLAGSLDEARKRFVEPKLIVLGEECDEPLCHRLSEWRVSDEQEIEPETDVDGRQCERAVMTRVRCYCAAHYKQPTFTSVRGVQSEVQIEEARPQW